VLAAAVVLAVLLGVAATASAAGRAPTKISGIKSHYTAAKLQVTGKLTSAAGVVSGRYVTQARREGRRLVHVARVKTDTRGRFTVTVLGGHTYRLGFAGDAELAPASAVTSVSGPTTGGSCAACHTSASALEASRVSPQEDVSKLVLSDAFMDDRHEKRGCWACHKGDPLAKGKDAAHDGMRADPTDDGAPSVCTACHAEIAARHRTSLHNTTNGLKNAFFGRLRNAPDEAHKSWRSKACVDCHASCGACHVARPRDPWVQSGPKGLLDGHRFLSYAKGSDTQSTCYVCHAGSITDPEAGFQKYDVHGTNGFTCLTCHKDGDIHGDGVERQTMIHSGAVAVECVQCHDVQDLAKDGRVHSFTHLNLATCQSCHGMPYRSCYECHGWQRIIDGKSAPFKVEYGLKLGFERGKITTMVKGPVDTHMLADQGIPEITADINVQSSWYAGFAHNVVKPAADQALCDRCHGPGTALMTQDDLQFPDFEADLLVPALAPVVAP